MFLKNVESNNYMPKHSTCYALLFNLLYMKIVLYISKQIGNAYIWIFADRNQKFFRQCDDGTAWIRKTSGAVTVGLEKTVSNFIYFWKITISNLKINLFNSMQ